MGTSEWGGSREAGITEEGVTKSLAIPGTTDGGRDAIC